MPLDQPEQLITATYSPEDNALRIYAKEWLDDAVYQKMKALGFKWAPTQKLFVAHRWTPSREDLCIELAGSIGPEETTLIERATAKAERLDNLAEKRADQANAFGQAAVRMANALGSDQPILSGHRSARKAEKTQQAAEREKEKAEYAAQAVTYWQWRATGVECHANYKSNPKVRRRRIKTLLTELRTHQRYVNHVHHCLDFWQKMQQEPDDGGRDERVKFYSGMRTNDGSYAPEVEGDSLYWRLNKGDITAEEVIELCISSFERRKQSNHHARWLNHIINRLAYESYELGGVSRYTGELTAGLLQVFARAYGTHKPKAKIENGQWALHSPVPLPMHIHNRKVLELTDDEWRDMMQGLNYEVPAPKPEKPPILNFRAHSISGQAWSRTQTFRQIELTKKAFSNINTDYRGVKLSACGKFRFKMCKHPEQTGYKAEWVSVFLTDSKVHPCPDSESIKKEPPTDE